MKPFRTALSVLASCVAAAAPVHAQSVQWASKQADSAVTNSAAVLGQPDGIGTSVAFYGFSYVRDFQPGKARGAEIEKALKLPAGELAKWDLIAFELGSSAGTGGGFDSSMWLIHDMQKLAAVVYDGKAKAAAPGSASGWAFRSGTLTLTEYKALFPGNRVFSGAAWLLIKLPAGVDKRSPNLAVWLGGGPIPGTDSDPAPDAIGVIR